jgi:anti-sigma B factor antagonist
MLKAGSSMDAHSPPHSKAQMLLVDAELPLFLIRNSHHVLSRYSEGTMPLDIHQREREAILILDLNGRIVAGPDAADFRRAVSSMIERGTKNMILNLKEVDYIDSTGLGSLVIAHSSCEKAGGAMKLLNVPKRSAELMVLTKLSTVFQIFDEEQAAINSFFPDREVRRFDILDFVKSREGEPARSSGEEAGAEPEAGEA